MTILKQFKKNNSSKKKQFNAIKKDLSHYNM